MVPDLEDRFEDRMVMLGSYLYNLYDDIQNSIKIGKGFVSFFRKNISTNQTIIGDTRLVLVWILRLSLTRLEK